MSWGKYPETLMLFFTKKYRLGLTTLVLGFSIFLVLFFYHPDKYDEYQAEVTKAGDSVLKFSTFLGAILIGAITTKIYNVRRERRDVMPELRQLTLKLNSFRKISNHLLGITDFWINDSLSYVKKTYPNLDFYSSQARKEVDEKYIHREEHNKFLSDNEKTGSAYFQLSLLASPTKKTFQDILYLENDVVKKYPFDFIEKLYLSDYGNHFWYYLDHKWSLFNEFFNFSAISINDRKYFMREFRKIDKLDSSEEFHQKLFVKIGNKIHQEIVTRLYILSYEVDRPVPKVINTFWLVLVFLVLFGILPQLFGGIFSVPFISSAISISTIASLVFFIVMKIKYMSKEEISDDDSPFWDDKFEDFKR